MPPCPDPIEAAAPRRATPGRRCRVAIVDDVISTGASTGAALRLLRGVGAEIVVIGTLVTEASIWRTSLGPDAQMVRALGSIPVFRPDGSGGLVEDWAG